MITFLPNIILVASSICTPGPTTLCDPTHSGTLENFLGKTSTANIFSVIAILVGIITIAMVVYSGIRMVASQGNEEELTKAKSAFQWSIAGFILIVLAFVIVSAIGNFLGMQNISPGPGAVVSPIGSSDILSLMGVIFTGVASFIGVFSLAIIIVSGFRYITARGNEEQTKKAKSSLTWAIIGLVVVLLGYIIVTAVAKLINAS